MQCAQSVLLKPNGDEMGRRQQWATSNKAYYNKLHSRNTDEDKRYGTVQKEAPLVELGMTRRAGRHGRLLEKESKKSVLLPSRSKLIRYTTACITIKTLYIITKAQIMT